MLRDDPFKQIGSFIDDIENSETLPKIRHVLSMHLQKLGFEIFSYQKIIPPTGKMERFYVSSYPQEWIKRYNEKKYLFHDIRSLGMHRFNRPYFWIETEFPDTITQSQRLVINEGSEFGIMSGASIPVHGATGIKAQFAVASDQPHSEFKKLFLPHRHSLHVMTAYLHEKLVALNFYDQPTAKRELSPRETEILSWATHGKTNAEIGDILSISSETVTKHFRNMCVKLHAANKTHAVAIALRDKIIFP